MNDKCETLNQARKDPEAEVRSAALAPQEAITYNPQRMLQVTTSHLAHAPNHIFENNGLEVPEPHPSVPSLMLTPTNQTDSHQQDHVRSTSLCVSEGLCFQM